MKHSSLKQVPQFGFLKHNIVKHNNYERTPDNFEQATIPLRVKQKARFSEFNMSEYKFTGDEKHLNELMKIDLNFGESTIEQVKPNKNAKDKANDPNHELNEILRHVGLQDIKEYQSQFIYSKRIKTSRRSGENDNSKTNPLFIRTQDARKLKNIMRKILIQRKQAEMCKSQR